MTMGEMIKYHRKQLKLSQEELGFSLEPPVNKAAVQKWENGTVENLKRTHIEQLAQKFHISPAELMCFPETEATHTQKTEILQIFYELNQDGQNELIRYIHYLASQNKYLEKRNSDMDNPSEP